MWTLHQQGQRRGKVYLQTWFSVFINFGFAIQVFLVTGGIWNVEYFSSIEILKDGDSTWTTVGNLPKAVYGIRGVSFNNRIIMTGEQCPR